MTGRWESPLASPPGTAKPVLPPIAATIVPTKWPTTRPTRFLPSSTVIRDFPLSRLLICQVVSPARTSHCLPVDPTLAYGPYPVGYTAASYPLQGSGTGLPQPSPTLDPGNAGSSFNPPSCIIGQIYYDGGGGLASGGSGATFGLNPNVPVDTIIAAAGAPGGTVFPCPDPSNPHVFSGVSGGPANGVGAIGLPGLSGITPNGKTYNIPCHHGPIIDQTTGAFCNQTNPGGNCAGAIAPAGLGG